MVSCTVESGVDARRLVVGNRRPSGRLVGAMCLDSLIPVPTHERAENQAKQGINDTKSRLTTGKNEQHGLRLRSLQPSSSNDARTSEPCLACRPGLCVPSYVREAQGGHCDATKYTTKTNVQRIGRKGRKPNGKSETPTTKSQLTKCPIPTPKHDDPIPKPQISPRVFLPRQIPSRVIFRFCFLFFCQHARFGARQQKQQQCARFSWPFSTFRSRSFGPSFGWLAVECVSRGRRLDGRNSAN